VTATVARRVTVTIHTTTEEPYWTISDTDTDKVIHDYIAGWYGDIPGEVCEETTWRKLRAHCAAKGWEVTEAWS
jgi:hypothetical protein